NSTPRRKPMPMPQRNPKPPQQRPLPKNRPSRSVDAAVLRNSAYMLSRRSLLAGMAGLPCIAAKPVAPPEPFGAVPSPRHLPCHELECTAFLHFTVNTFTDKEWGYGDEDPDIFNPGSFDADETVSALADAGMRGVILTAKHHDGFCLWPTKTTEHS